MRYRSMRQRSQYPEICMLSMHISSSRYEACNEAWGFEDVLDDVWENALWKKKTRKLILQKYIIRISKIFYTGSTNKFPPFAKDGATNKL